MQNTTTIEKEFTFRADHTVLCSSGDTYEDMEPLFKFIEEYTAELGGSTKWVSESLNIYHKDFNNVNSERVTFDLWLDFIEYSIHDWGDEDSDIAVSFGDEVEDEISNLEQLKESVKKFVTQELPNEFYYTKEEQELRNAKKVLAEAEQKERDDKRKIFAEKLVCLRISRAEFEDALKYYQ